MPSWLFIWAFLSALSSLFWWVLLSYGLLQITILIGLMLFVALATLWDSM